MVLAALTARVDESDKSAFDIKQDDPFYSASNQAYIMKSAAELKAGKGTVHELIEVDDV